MSLKQRDAITYFHCSGEFLSFLQGFKRVSLKMSNTVVYFNKFSSARRTILSIILADFGTRTEKGCLPPVLDCMECIKSLLLMICHDKSDKPAMQSLNTLKSISSLC